MISHSGPTNLTKGQTESRAHIPRHGTCESESLFLPGPLFFPVCINCILRSSAEQGHFANCLCPSPPLEGERGLPMWVTSFIQSYTRINEENNHCSSVCVPLLYWVTLVKIYCIHISYRSHTIRSNIDIKKLQLECTSLIYSEVLKRHVWLFYESCIKHFQKQNVVHAFIWLDASDYFAWVSLFHFRDQQSLWSANLSHFILYVFRIKVSQISLCTHTFICIT